MQKTLFIVLILTALFSCKKERVVVSGHLIDEATGKTVNPYPNAKVRLVFDQSYGYTEEVGTSEIDENGFYSIKARTKKVGVEARLQLYVDDSGHNNIDRHITLKNIVGYDFMLP
ncbi:MAG: hypothetical protein V4677_06600 [Bacteroidota bacterium]